MIIVMEPNATDETIQRVIDSLDDRGYGHHISHGVERTLIGAIGAPEGEKQRAADQLVVLEGVERVVPILRPYKLVSREHQEKTSVVNIGDVPFGQGNVGIIAGPCGVENEEQIMQAAEYVKKAGACCLRAGAFKPRTSPYDFQGLGEEGLKLLKQASEATGLPTVTEARDTSHIPLVCEYADALQIGARNMQNYDLLRAVGETQIPVVLKRGFANSIEEWLKAAEYIASGGNLHILLCERGIRTFETATRFTLDLAGMAKAKQDTHLPIIVDPSHSTGEHSLVAPMTLAGLAAGADGAIIEVHPHPDRALSDGPQQLTPKNFERLMQQVRNLADALGLNLQ
ncbi:MAG: 3-deoxy-7-phosphoheptulonate synthase [Armatimonadota bacterium]